MKKIFFITVLLLASLTVFPQATFEAILTANQPIIHVAGDESDEAYAYTTSEGIYVQYGNTQNFYTDLTYEFSGQTFTPDLSQITDIGYNGDSRLYAVTSDEHVLIFEEGAFVFGLPVYVKDLYTADEFVYGLMTLAGELWPVVFEDDYGNVDLLISQFDDEIVDAFQDLDPELFAPYETLDMYISNASNRIAMTYQSGHEIKIHNAIDSHFPCTGFQDAVTLGKMVNVFGNWGVSMQLYLICDGKVAYVTKFLENLWAYDDDWTADEWVLEDFPAMGYGNAVQIEAPKAHFTADVEERYYVFGINDKNENGIFIINPIPKIICELDVPGQGVLSDLYVDNDRYIYVASGNTLWEVDLTNFICGNTVATKEPAFSSSSISVKENPVSSFVTAQIETPFQEHIKGVHLLNANGEFIHIKPKINDNIIQFPVAHLPPNVYFLQVITDRNIYHQKIIKQ